MTERRLINLVTRYTRACDAYEEAIRRWRDDMNLDYQAAMNHASDAKQAAERDLRAAGREWMQQHQGSVA